MQLIWFSPVTATYSCSELHVLHDGEYPLVLFQVGLIYFCRPKGSKDLDLVEVYAPAQGPASDEQFPPRSACVFIAITNGGDYTPVRLPYKSVKSVLLTSLILDWPSRVWTSNRGKIRI